MDMVHLVVGRPGVILLAEGNPQRVRSLLGQEKRRLAKVIGNAPLHDYVIGQGEGELPIRKLRTTLMRLPRNLTGKDVNALDKRLKALSARPQMPKGAIPKNMRPPRGAFRQIARSLTRSYARRAGPLGPGLRPCLGRGQPAAGRPRDVGTTIEPATRSCRPRRRPSMIRAGTTRQPAARRAAVPGARPIRPPSAHETHRIRVRYMPGVWANRPTKKPYSTISTSTGAQPSRTAVWRTGRRRAGRAPSR